MWAGGTCRTGHPFVVARRASATGGAVPRDPQLVKPFGDNALTLHGLGLVVLPCGKGDGKSPLVKGWQGRKSAKTVAIWARKFAAANIGVACGLSGYVVVDVDKRELVETMLERFGATPLMTRTPSGGAHLWYRKVGEVKSSTLGPSLVVDIKADGGQVIVPPPFNRQSGVPYEFERGSWDDLTRLPPFRKEALDGLEPSTKSSPHAQAPTGVVSEGERNRTLFRYLMSEVPHATSLNDLLAEARRFNEQNLSPLLPAAEVEKTARQVWKYEQAGQNWIGHGRGGVELNAAVVDDLLSRAHGEDALALLVKLERSHGARISPFAVCAKAMARDEVIAGWKDPRRYTRACNMLLVRGAIKPVSRARRDTQGCWIAAKYKFTKPGTNNAPNITTHPSPLAPHVSKTC